MKASKTGCPSKKSDKDPGHSCLLNLCQHLDLPTGTYRTVGLKRLKKRFLRCLWLEFQAPFLMKTYFANTMKSSRFIYQGFLWAIDLLDLII